MGARWLDLVDPTREELLATLPIQVDPEVVETLVARPGDGREPRPLLESHGAYVFGVLVAIHPLPHENRASYQEVDLVATPGVVVTVRKTPGGDEPFDVSALHPAADQKADAGELVYGLVDEVAESFLEALGAAYAEIEELEDGLDAWEPKRVRMRALRTSGTSFSTAGERLRQRVRRSAASWTDGSKWVITRCFHRTSSAGSPTRTRLSSG